MCGRSWFYRILTCNLLLDQYVVVYRSMGIN